MSLLQTLFQPGLSTVSGHQTLGVSYNFRRPFEDDPERRVSKTKETKPTPES